MKKGVIMIEYLDIYDRNENYLGFKSRKECHESNVNFYHKVVWLWLINDKKEILIQQRSWNKKFRAGCWEELSVAGHILKDESPTQAAQREIMEELGVNALNLTYLDKWVNDESKEIVYFYSGFIFNSIKELVLQTEEVIDAKFIDYKQFENMLTNNIFGTYPLEYKNFVLKLTSKLID